MLLEMRELLGAAHTQRRTLTHNAYMLCCTYTSQHTPHTLHDGLLLPAISLRAGTTRWQGRDYIQKGTLTLLQRSYGWPTITATAATTATALEGKTLVQQRCCCHTHHWLCDMPTAPGSTTRVDHLNSIVLYMAGWLHHTLCRAVVWHAHVWHRGCIVTCMQGLTPLRGHIH